MTQRELLSKFGTYRARSNDEAWAHCDLRFRRLTEFKFTRGRETELSSSGPVRDAWRMAVVRSTGHCLTIDEDSATLLVPYLGRISISRGKETCLAEPGACIFVGRGERTTILSEGFVGGIIQLPCPAVRELAEEVELGNADHLVSGMAMIRSNDLVTASQNLIDELDRRGTQWWDVKGPLCGMRSRLGELLLVVCDDRFSDAKPRRGAAEASMEHVARAEEYMRERLGDDMSISDIAREAGVSPRALQSAFRRHRGCSPKAILTTLRLAEARARLRDPASEASIANIATDLGLGHFGRFSEAYRRAYGERPSETRRELIRGSRPPAA